MSLIRLMSLISLISPMGLITNEGDRRELGIRKTDVMKGEFGGMKKLYYLCGVILQNSVGTINGIRDKVIGIH